jgi:aromatic-L-amino-acid decarboxylase
MSGRGPEGSGHTRAEPSPWADPLSIDVETMRRSGYAAIDAMLELIDQPDPVIRRVPPATMARRLQVVDPDRPQSIDAVLRRVVDDVLPNASKIGHRGYLAYIPGSTTWPAALATFMTSVSNIYCGTWMEAAGPSQVELDVLDWFRQWIGMPEGTTGILVSGGSAANLTALAAARELRIGPMDPRAIVYCSDQAHSSVGRSARVLGFRPDQVRVIPSDQRFRMRTDALETAMNRDLEAGALPLAVVAAAGSTNTGAVDPLPELAAMCRERDVWLHVDGAYGGFGVLAERGAAALSGLELADSVALDPHKWLQMPQECGALLVREPGALERAFSVLPDYLVDAHGDADEVNFCDRGLQLTRSARGVPVWAALTTFGIDAFRTVVDHAFDLVSLAEQTVIDDPDLALMNPASLGIVCFRREIAGLTEAQTAAANRWLAAELEATGSAMVSTTRLHGRFAVRLCALNHLSDETDIRRVLDHFARTPVPDEVTTSDRGEIPSESRLLSCLDADGVLMLRDQSVRRTLPAGTKVVSRWNTDRDFYVVLYGRLAAHVDDRRVEQLGAGDFFGEIAATDWGSGFGYLRLADVIAETECEVLVVPPDGLATLMAHSTDFRDLVVAARARRLIES